MTVVLISYQDERILDECLESIRNQSYPQALVDILLVDGGSTDRTAQMAHKFQARVISRPDLRNEPGQRGGIALLTPVTDLILAFSADNRFQESDGLAKLIEPFRDNNISGSCTLRYGLRRRDPLLSRYFALIGGNDPIAVGLGKADRGPHDTRTWHSFGKVEDRGGWYKVKLRGEASEVPTLGANGFIYRRDLIKKSQYAQYGTHIDLCLDLIRQGHDQFAFVKDRHVLHLIDGSILRFMKRRLLYADIYSTEFVPRIYNVFQKRDFSKLLIILLTYPTVIIPLLRAVKGYWTVRDPAWFMHPIVCAVFIAGYSIHYTKRFTLRFFGGKRKMDRVGY